MSWLMICHGSVGIGNDLIGSSAGFDPYCAQLLHIHVSKTACLIPGQKNSTSRTMRTVDS